MSILIKGATLPDSCWDCEPDFAYQIGCELWQDFEGFCEHRHPDCPLVEVPTPHGRLIDESERIQKWYEQNDITEEDFGAVFMGYQQIADFIRNAPTILEAEE